MIRHDTTKATTTATIRGTKVAVTIALAILAGSLAVGFSAAGFFPTKRLLEQSQANPNMLRCTIDNDCQHLICPQVIGSDHPTCDTVAKKCYCGETLTQSAYFKFENTYNTKETFIFKLTDPNKIKLARRILTGSETERIHVMGRVTKDPASYNQPWSFSLVPQSIEFFSNSAEYCDAGIAYVEQHFTEFCGERLNNCQWCPWNSHLISEVYP